MTAAQPTPRYPSHRPRALVRHTTTDCGAHGTGHQPVRRDRGGHGPGERQPPRRLRCGGQRVQMVRHHSSRAGGQQSPHARHDPGGAVAGVCPQVSSSWSDGSWGTSMLATVMNSAMARGQRLQRRWPVLVPRSAPVGPVGRQWSVCWTWCAPCLLPRSPGRPDGDLLPDCGLRGLEGRVQARILRSGLTLSRRRPIAATMTACEQCGSTLARVTTWSLTPALLAGTLVSEMALPGGVGVVLTVADASLVVAPVACWLVGVVVTGRAPDQLAGWAFLGLATAVAWSAFSDTSARLLLASDGGTATYRLFATISDSSFVWWFVFLALVLQLTPPPSTRPVAAHRLPGVTLAAGGTFQVMAPALDSSGPAARTALQPARGRRAERRDQSSRDTRDLPPRGLPHRVGRRARARVASLGGQRSATAALAGASRPRRVSSGRSCSPQRTTTAPPPCCSVSRWSASSPGRGCRS